MTRIAIKKHAWHADRQGVVRVEILGESDFEGHAKNYPGNGWELVRFPSPVAIHPDTGELMTEGWSANTYKTKKEALARHKELVEANRV